MIALPSPCRPSCQMRTNPDEGQANREKRDADACAEGDEAGLIIDPAEADQHHHKDGDDEREPSQLGRPFRRSGDRFFDDETAHQVGLTNLFERAPLLM